MALAIEDRERQIRADVQAVRSFQGDLTASWHAKHRRWHSPAVKARLVRGLGRRRYLESFPW